MAFSGFSSASFHSHSRSTSSSAPTPTPPVTPTARRQGNRHSTPIARPSGFSANPMYSFQSIHEDPQALDDMVAEQATSLNALQQQFDLLKQDADHFRSVSTEQQAQIDQMRQQIQDLSSQCPSSHRERIPRTLSNLVQTLHTAMDISFDVTDRYDSVLNKRVRCELYRELRGQEEAHGKPMIERAMSRLFEKLRRGWRESQSDMADRVEADAKSRRKAARRRRLYIRRSKHIATEEEREKWQQLDSNYMTDESSDGEDGLLSHHPAWRSSELNDLVKALEERRKSSLLASQHHRPPAKQRTESSPSRMLPPAGAPVWTLDTGH